MIGGLKRSSSSLAIVAAAGLFAGGTLMTPAQAADLGGDCCADLEERVAELEATSVRSGNRKVKVKLSGQINTAVMFWDNGDTEDVYVIDNDESSSRVRVDAVGTISPGITAGMVLEYDVEVAGGASISESEDGGDDGSVTPGSGGFRFQARRFNWFVQGSLGKISIGQGSTAADGALEVSFANTWVGGVGYGLATTNINAFRTQNINTAVVASLVAAGAPNPAAGNPIPLAAAGPVAASALTWGGFGTDGDRFRENRVRYDSPTFAGFTVSGSWGEDDTTDLAVRYANEFGGLKLAAAAMWNRVDDEGTTDVEADTYGGSVALQFGNFHVQGGYAETDVETGSGFEREHYWIAAGVQFRASTLGLSEVTVQYIQNDLSGVAVSHTAPGGFIGSADNITTTATGSGEYTAYGIGFAQNVDAIGGTLYLSYNHHESELAGSSTVAVGAAAAAAAAGTAFDAEDEFDQVVFGMRFRY